MSFSRGYAHAFRLILKFDATRKIVKGLRCNRVRNEREFEENQGKTTIIGDYI